MQQSRAAALSVATIFDNLRAQVLDDIEQLSTLKHMRTVHI